MKTVLIIQSELPGYRDFLWQGLRRSVSLYLADESANKLILPDGGVTSFNDYKFQMPLDCLVLNAGIRDILKALRYNFKYKSLATIGWTQFVGKNKSIISRAIKSVYLMALFDQVMLYYEHEKSLIPFERLKKRVLGLNNTVADGPLSVHHNISSRSFLFLGRYTEKSKLTLLLEAASFIDGIEVHVIGARVDELPEKLRKINFHFHGKSDDSEFIKNVASRCVYFVYPGDVGLSIVHAIKLGLIPVVHADLDEHMPECRAVAQAFPVIYFQKDDCSSLTNILRILVEIKPTEMTKEWIASQGRKVFSEKVMISNFVKALEGC